MAFRKNPRRVFLITLASLFLLLGIVILVGALMPGDEPFIYQIR